jgi:dTDP-4-amino-4,6-dideoxygalactose transaminase
MGIPLVDLSWQHEAIRDEVQTGWARVIDRSGFIGGPEIARFEEAYAAHERAAACVGVANGTDALEIALRAVGVGAGDEVLVPTNSFAASAHAVARVGARPAFVDVDPEHLLVDPKAVARRLDSGVRALMAVHLYGQMAPMEPLVALAREASIPLIEDAAQAHGARQNGRPPGSLGAAATTSFYPSKNLGAYGDAGALLTANADLAARARSLRNHGSRRRDHHDDPGFNSRLDALQAVVLSAKLRHLDAWNALRRSAAAHYESLLGDLPDVRLPGVAAGNEHVWHLYAIRVPRRDRVLEELERAEIGAGVHYRIPLHLEGAFASLGHRPGEFPVAERAADELISLPIFPGIRKEQQERVADVLRAAVR